MLMMAGASERHAPSFSKLRRPQELKKGQMFPCYLQPCRRGTVNNPGGECPQIRSGPSSRITKGCTPESV